MDRNSFFISSSLAGAWSLPMGNVGQRANPGPYDVVRTLINSRPQALQVSTITVGGGPASSHAFTVTFDLNSVTFTSDASATLAEVTAGLAAAIQYDPIAGGLVDVVSAVAGTGVITVRARNNGISVAIATSDAGLTVATTTASAVANPVNFGAAVVSIPAGWSNNSEICAVASTADLTAQVDTITVDYAAGETYTIEITVEGRTYIAGPVAADTDDNTTATAVRAAITAAVPTSKVVCTGATDQVILTAALAGKAFVTNIGLKSGTVARLALVNTTSGPATDFMRVFAGVAEATNATEGTYSATSDAGATAYRANAGVACVRICPGGIRVENAQTPTDNSAVYVELAPGQTAGQFYTTTSATRLLLDPLKFRWMGNPDLAADGLGQLVIVG